MQKAKVLILIVLKMDYNVLNRWKIDGKKNAEDFTDV